MAEGEDLLRVWLKDEGRFDYMKPGQTPAAQGEFKEMLWSQQRSWRYA